MSINTDNSFYWSIVVFHLCKKRNATVNRLSGGTALNPQNRLIKAYISQKLEFLSLEEVANT